MKINETTNEETEMNDPTIQYQGDVWRIINVGANNGQESYAHLASTTQYRQQKNGKYPIQAGDCA